MAMRPVQLAHCSAPLAVKCGTPALPQTCPALEVYKWVYNLTATAEGVETAPLALKHACVVLMLRPKAAATSKQTSAAHALADDRTPGTAEGHHCNTAKSRVAHSGGFSLGDGWRGGNAALPLVARLPCAGRV